MSVRAASMQLYLNQLDTLRQDASSPSTVTPAREDHLDDLINSYPTIDDNSPVLGRRPSLDVYGHNSFIEDDSEDGPPSFHLSNDPIPQSHTSSLSPQDLTTRPRAPTPSATPSHIHSPHPESSPIARSLSARDLLLNHSDPSMLLRSASDASPRPRANTTTPSPNPYRTPNGNSKLNAFAPPTLVTTGEAVSTPHLPDLPDPSIYPDPYPYHPRQQHYHQNGVAMTPPISLFSEGSSSASTRSSLAFNSPYSGVRTSDHYENTSDDYHRRAAPSALYASDTSYETGEGDLSGELERPSDVGVGLTSDEAVHLAHSSSTSSFASGSRARITDPTRWSGSSFGRGMNESSGSALRNQASYDWHDVDERDEYGLATDEETGDEDDEDEDEDGNDADDIEADRTAAIVIAEEGRGLIVRGEGQPVDRLIVRPGTTHLLLSNSSTPNQMPAFLSAALLNIPSTLLALDISGNLLPALPPALASCVALEELNIAVNPLRVLPAWIANLTSLRVLIADSTSITTVPQALHSLTSLHTLSLRRNKLYSLPSWLCHLSSLETLLVDGNPFIEPWMSLIAPLWSTVDPESLTPAYPPNTPQPPVTPVSATSTPNTSLEPQSFSPFVTPSTPDTNPRPDSGLRRSMSSPHRRPPQNSTYSTASSRPPSSLAYPSSPGQIQAIPADYPAVRPRTGPSTSTVRAPPAAASASLVGSYLAALDPTLHNAEGEGEELDTSSRATLQSQNQGQRQIRRMKSADELTRMSAKPLAQRLVAEEQDALPGRRFESLPRGPGRAERTRAPLSMWADASGNPSRTERGPAEPLSRSRPPSRSLHVSARESAVVATIEDDAQANNEKSRKWGFLKKMSMGRMRAGSTSRDQTKQTPVRGLNGAPIPTSPSPPRARPEPVHASTALVLPRIVDENKGPTAPSLPTFSPITPLPMPSMTLSPVAVSVVVEEDETLPPPPPPKHDLPRKASRDALQQTLAPPSMNLSPLSPSPPSSLSPVNTRAGKRRSFLPINFSNAQQLPVPIPVPSPGPFVGNSIAVGGEETGDVSIDEHDHPQYVVTKDPDEEAHALEEQRRRDSYQRALRSIMAYLRDLSDLSGTPLEGPGGPGSPIPQSTPGSPTADDARRRRPTLTDSRVFSDGSFVSTTSSTQSASITGQLNKKASTASLRGAFSVSTADSGGSGVNSEERKYKEDKNKRVMIAKEIVATERTYVTQLQELIDIYVNPSAALVSSTFGNQNGKETVIPTSERRIVFNGLESLLTFHRDSFLPALEKAIAPLLESSDDPGGETSANVANQLAMVFVSHAAFMRMYSTYINNFDNCVTRIKKWTEKEKTPVSGTVTPAAGAANVVGLGLSMSVVAGVAPEAAPGNLVTLSSSQKKRIKSFLKRCRLSPRHSQLNLEGYLLLPVQRIPRYRLLLEDMMRSTPPKSTGFEDPLEVAVKDISSLANMMNEGKRESEARRKLVHWQTKISGKFPSPLVQPHRRLIMDGHLHLSRVARKGATYAEGLKADGEKTLVQVECLNADLTPRPLIALLCNDMLVLCKDPSHGKDPHANYDLWAVLRMQTSPQPASVVHGSTLRLVDNKAILYFDAISTSEALTWSRAINLHIPASR